MAAFQMVIDSWASNAQASGSTITLEQARLVANHVTVVKDSSALASTGTPISQNLILAELHKIPQRFTK